MIDVTQTEGRQQNNQNNDEKRSIQIFGSKSEGSPYRIYITNAKLSGKKQKKEMTFTITPAPAS